MATVRDGAWFAAVVRHTSALAGHRTQAALADASGLSVNTVVNVVTAMRDSYRPRTLEQLAAGLGIDPTWLLACAMTGTGHRARRDQPAAPGAWVGIAAVDAAARLRTSCVFDDALSPGAVFVVSVAGVQASVVEQALEVTLARLTKQHAGAQAQVRHLP